MKILPPTCTQAINNVGVKYNVRCVRAAISRLLYRNKFVNMNRDKRIMANGYRLYG